MGLSAREQQALDSIQATLTGSDPELASLLAVFARLVSGEEMPVREKIRMSRQRRGTRGSDRRRRYLTRGKVRRRRDKGPRRLNSRLLALMLWLVITIGLAVIALVSSHGGDGTCQGSGARVSVLNRGAGGAVPVPGQPGRRGPLRGSGYFRWTAAGNGADKPASDCTGL